MAENLWNPTAPGGIGGLLVRKVADNKQYFHYDHIGNLVQTVNASGDVIGDLFYSPYGEPLGGTINQIDRNQPFGFSTKRSDFASGLVYFGYRFYVPYMERWLNRDPIGTDGGLNIYGYVENNPLIYVDPHGLFLCDILSSLGDTNISLGATVGAGISINSGLTLSASGITGSVGVGVGAGISGRGALGSESGAGLSTNIVSGSIGDTDRSLNVDSSFNVTAGSGIGISATASAGTSGAGFGVDGSAVVGISIYSGIGINGDILKCSKDCSKSN